MSQLANQKRMTADALRRAIRGIEEAGSPGRSCLPLGMPEIDRALPGGGLRLGCIHEITGDEAATGFCAALLARAGAQAGALLWLAQGDDLYAPGLVRYGIGAGKLLVVSGLRRQADMLWAMEEALRCRAVRGVVAEAGRIGLAPGRRLMLAAEGTGVLGLVLSRRAGERRGGGVGVGGGVSRWRVTAVPSGAAVPNGRKQPETAGSRWRVELLHCRGGCPAEWIVGWGDCGWSALPSCFPRTATAQAPPAESRSRHPGAGIRSRFPRSRRVRRVRHTGSCPLGPRTSEGCARLHRPSQPPA